jgi:hypothetical protein
VKIVSTSRFKILFMWREWHTFAPAAGGGAGPKSSSSLLLSSEFEADRATAGRSSRGAGGGAGPRTLRRLSLLSGLLERFGEGFGDSWSSESRFRLASR